MLWALESSAYGRADELAETQEGVVVNHVIAGMVRKRCLLYKVNLHVRSSCKMLINDDDKIDARGPGRGTEVLRSASAR